MISRRGSSKQPVRPLPSASRGSKSAEHDEAVAAAAAHASSTCSFCQTSVFKSILLQRLKAAHEAGQRNVELKYTRSTKELHQSILDGCKWCEKLAEGISTAIGLNYPRKLWDEGRSDGSSVMEGDGENGGDPAQGVSATDDKEPTADITSTDDSPDDGDDEKSVYEEGGRGPGSAECTFGLSELRESHVEVSVNVEFVQFGRSKSFSVVRVSLEMWQSEEITLAGCRFGLKEDKAVILKFEVFESQGMPQYLIGRGSSKQWVLFMRRAPLQ